MPCGENAKMLAESSCTLSLLDRLPIDPYAVEAADEVGRHQPLVRTVWQGVAVRHRRSLSDEADTQVTKCMTGADCPDSVQRQAEPSLRSMSGADGTVKP